MESKGNRSKRTVLGILKNIHKSIAQYLYMVDYFDWPKRNSVADNSWIVASVKAKKLKFFKTFSFHIIL